MICEYCGGLIDDCTCEEDRQEEYREELEGDGDIRETSYDGDEPW
jgi:hypothetical protein